MLLDQQYLGECIETVSMEVVCFAIIGGDMGSLLHCTCPCSGMAYTRPVALMARTETQCISTTQTVTILSAQWLPVNCMRGGRKDCTLFQMLPNRFIEHRKDYFKLGSKHYYVYKTYSGA